MSLTFLFLSFVQYLNLLVFHPIIEIPFNNTDDLPLFSIYQFELVENKIFIVEKEKIGDFFIQCGHDLIFEIISETDSQISFYSTWNAPNKYFSEKLFVGLLSGNGLYSNIHEDRPILTTNDLIGNEQCFVGWYYDDSYLGTTIKIKQLLNGTDIDKRFNGSIKLRAHNFIHVLKWNSNFYIYEEPKKDSDNNDKSKHDDQSHPTPPELPVIPGL